MDFKVKAYKNEDGINLSQNKEHSWPFLNTTVLLKFNKQDVIASATQEDLILWTYTLNYFVLQVESDLNQELFKLCDSLNVFSVTA